MIKEKYKNQCAPKRIVISRERKKIGSRIFIILMIVQKKGKEKFNFLDNKKRAIHKRIARVALSDIRRNILHQKNRCVHFFFHPLFWLISKGALSLRKY